MGRPSVEWTLRCLCMSVIRVICNARCLMFQKSRHNCPHGSAGRILTRRMSLVIFPFWDEPVSAGHLKSDRLQSRTSIARLEALAPAIPQPLSPPWAGQTPIARLGAPARARARRAHRSPSRRLSPALSRRLPPAATSYFPTTPQPPGPRCGARTRRTTWPGRERVTPWALAGLAGPMASLARSGQVPMLRIPDWRPE